MNKRFDFERSKKGHLVGYLVLHEKENCEIVWD